MVPRPPSEDSVAVSWASPGSAPSLVLPRFGPPPRERHVAQQAERQYRFLPRSPKSVQTAGQKSMRAVPFRIALSIAVLGLLTTLALCLIIVQNLTFHEAIRVAAAAQMDAVSAASQGQLKSQIETLSTLVRVLSYDPFLADSDQRSEAGGAVGLFKTALREVPQADSIYVGYDNGCWLQVRRAEDLNCNRETAAAGACGNRVHREPGVADCRGRSPDATLLLQ